MPVPSPINVSLKQATILYAQSKALSHKEKAHIVSNIISCYHIYHNSFPSPDASDLIDLNDADGMLN